MKPPMTVKKRRIEPDLSVRIPEDNYADLQKVAKILKISLARLVVDLTVEIFGFLDLPKKNPPSEKAGGPNQSAGPVWTRAIRANQRLRELALKIHGRKRRSLPMNKTVPTRINFTKEERDDLVQVAADLHWAQSYVIWEAVYAALELATFKPPLETLPDIILLYRGKQQYKATAEKDTLKTLSALLDIPTQGVKHPEKRQEQLITSLNLVGKADNPEE